MRKRLIVSVPVVLATLLSALVWVPAAQAVRFGTLHEYGTPADPQKIAAADLNRDGVTDLVTTSWTSMQVSTLLGNGAGGFGTAVSYGVLYPYSPEAVAVGDFNGDGDPDVATSCWSVRVYLGDGLGGLGAPLDMTPSHEPRALAVGDFNGDAKADIAALCPFSDGISVLLGDGAGGFTETAVDPAIADGSLDMTVGDLNGDGRPDLIIAHYAAACAGVLLGDGAGGFAAEFLVTTGPTSPSSVTVADVDRDGDQDIVAAGGSSLSVLLGDGTGSFPVRRDLAVAAGLGVQDTVVGDFNGDLKPDIAASCANYSWDTGGKRLALFLGKGGGAFAAPGYFALPQYPGALASDDFNRDGKRDVATIDEYANTVGVSLNTTPPRIGTTSPGRGRAGVKVTIGGWGFGTSRGTAKVFFGTKAATRYASWACGKIVVKVPTLAAGRIRLTVKTSAGRSNAKYFRVL